MPRRSLTSDLVQQVSSAQAGLITTAQLAEIGVPTSTISRRYRLGGMWNRVLPGVHLVSGGQPDQLQRERAALLYAGPQSMLTGTTALRYFEPRLSQSLWLPDDRFVTESVFVLVPHERRRASVAFVDIERTRRFPSSEDAVLCNGLLLAPPARALCDAARRMRRESDVRAFVTAATRLELVTAQDLIREVNLAQKRGTAFIRAAVQHAERGVWSAPEADLRELVAATDFPEVLWNTTVVDANGEFLGIPDGWVDSVALAFEVDSREHHSDGADWERTLARQARYAAAGVLCVPLTPRLIRESPHRVMHLLRSALAQAECRPRPLVRAIVSSQRAVGRRTPLPWAG